MIIIDNTVLTSLAHIEFLHLPSELFGEASILESVYDEGVKSADDSTRIKRIKTAIEEDHIKVTRCTDEEKEMKKRYKKDLGAGESSCLAIALKRECLVGTDDLKARKSAKEKSVDMIGTLGILRMAFLEDKIEESELKSSVSDLNKILYFTNELEQWVLSVLDDQNSGNLDKIQ